jgi:hypothetical protein
MGNLYQLHSTPGLVAGHPVFVDGPHDRFGRIVKTVEEFAPLGQPYWLYMIRGTGSKEPEELLLRGRSAIDPTVIFSDPTSDGARMKAVSRL